MSVFALFLWGGLALAQEPTEEEQRARVLYENGAILYDEGRYEDAIVAWQEAHALSGRPLLLYNIASAQERLGQWQAALDTLNRYRAYAEADERERLDRRIANLERRLEEEGPQTTAPVSTEAPPASITETAQVGGGGRWMTPTALTVGGVGVATGVVFGLRAQSARQEALGLCVDHDSSLLCPATAADALRRETVSAVVADGAFVVGAVGLLGGTALMVFTDAPVVPAPGGVLIRGRF